ncbi:hypothetical protein OC835_002209 [Tilletia horrida]|nr:hypothetical protein OC835_002209 [Tilletia horrida]
MAHVITDALESDGIRARAAAAAAGSGAVEVRINIRTQAIDNTLRSARGTATPSTDPLALAAGTVSDEVIQEIAAIEALLHDDSWERVQVRKVDLVALFQVSKRMRPILLALLVESVNNVKFLRLWNNVAHYHAHFDDMRTPGSPFRKSHTAEYAADTWTDLGALFDRLPGEEGHSSLLELSFGQFELHQLYQHIRPCPRLLARVASIRIISDFGPSRRQGMDEDAIEIQLHHYAVHLAGDLEDILHWRAPPAALLLRPPLAHSTELSVMPAIRLRLWQRVPEQLRELTITAERCTDEDGASMAQLLQLRWPALQRNTLDVERLLVGHATHHRAGDALQSLLVGAAQLEHFLTHIMLSTGEELEPTWTETAIPQPRSCNIELDVLLDEQVGVFAERFEHVEALHISQKAEHFGLARHPNIVKNLRKTRGDMSVINDSLNDGVPLRHIACQASELGEHEGSKQREQGGDEETTRSRSQHRLQRQPASFRPLFHRRTGAWEDMHDLTTAFTLCDHLGDDGPRLKFV